MCKYFGVFLLLTVWQIFECSAAETRVLNAHKFQIEFLQDFAQEAEITASATLNRYLLQLQKDLKYAKYAPQFEQMLDSNHNITAQEKMLFVKQLLDVPKEADELQFEENLYTLRNVKFLQKFQELLQQLQDQSAEELRDVKLYALCRQFQLQHAQPPGSNSNNLAPLAPQQQPTANTIQFQTLSHFGALLYARLNATGAAIIDDYLNTIRRLLVEVLQQNRALDAEQAKTHDLAPHTDQLSKLLQEVDALLAVGDYAAKRQRLYDYLEHTLATDYELFQQSERGQHDIFELLQKLKQRGFDIVFMFLLSNFELLERLFMQWQQLTATMSGDDADLQQLRAIHALYVKFKWGGEKSAQYEEYSEAVKQLNERTSVLAAQDDVKIFEILHFATQNFGVVTLNMIKTKCKEL